MNRNEKGNSNLTRFCVYSLLIFLIIKNSQVSYKKNAFQKYIYFKKQMYVQMSLKTLQISFYFKYI